MCSKAKASGYCDLFLLSASLFVPHHLSSSSFSTLTPPTIRILKFGSLSIKQCRRERFCWGSVYPRFLELNPSMMMYNVLCLRLHMETHTPPNACDFDMFNKQVHLLWFLFFKRRKPHFYELVSIYKKHLQSSLFFSFVMRSNVAKVYNPM